MPDQAQDQPPSNGNFLSGLFSNPLLMIGGLLLAAFMFFPNLFGAIGSMISGLMGGNKEQGGDAAASPLGGLLKMFGMGGNDQSQQNAPAQPATQAQPAAATSIMGMLSGAMNNLSNGVSNGVAALTGNPANGAGTVAKDKSRAYWCAVNAKGEVLGGNCVNELGDNASITKMLSCRLAACDPKLPAGFMQRPEIQHYVERMAHLSDNAAADRLLDAVAKESHRTIAQVIGDYNGRLKEMGFKQTTIANFSGLPSKSDILDTGAPYLFVEGCRNVGTAYENAVWTQQFGSQFPQLAALFAPKDNHTGMGNVDAVAVKTGTARGVIDPDSGATKSAVAFDGKGSIAVIESREGEWMDTINLALNVEKKGGFPVQNASGAITAQNGGGKQTQNTMAKT